MSLKNGDPIKVDLKTGKIENLRNKEVFNAEPFSDVQFEVYQKGGLLGK
jgi:3-isopropylmalate dehydratase small subunit